jgi:hypothetical protein
VLGERIMAEKCFAITWYGATNYKKICIFGNCVTHGAIISYNCGLPFLASI